MIFTLNERRQGPNSYLGAAISLVSMAMIARGLEPKVTVAAAAGVAATSILAGGLVTVLA